MLCYAMLCYAMLCYAVLCCAMLSHVRFFATPWTVARQAPLFMGFSKQEYWTGIFSTPGSNLGLLHCRWILYHLSHEGSPRILEWVIYHFSRGCSCPRNWTRVSCIAGRFFTSWATREAHFRFVGSVQFSRSVVSDSSRSQESQHARPPCPSPTPRVHSDSRPSSQWCHPAISSSVVPFSSCPQSLPVSDSFIC